MTSITTFVPVSRHRRSRLTARALTTVSAIALLSSFYASQDARAAAPQTADGALEELVVTGSRIIREGYEASTPLSVVSTEALQTAPNGNIAAFLNTMPVFAGSTQPQSSQNSLGPGGSGANVLNLRGLGAVRTLVLLDGQRSVGSLLTGGVDIDGFPQQLIQRVDVVTGGASSVYGSDAVAGVVNFVLDRQFTGVKGEISGGVTSYGDAKQYKISLSGGFDFGGDRGHVLLSGEMHNDDGIVNGVGNRTWNRVGRQDMLNPAYGTGPGQSTSVPQRLVLNNVGSANSTLGGLVFAGPLKGLAFGEGGVPYQFHYGDLVAYPFMRGGDWREAEVQTQPSLVQLWPIESRQNLFARADYDITDQFNIFGQLSWATSHLLGTCCNVFLPGTVGPVIKADNAFLPASVRAQMTALGVAQIQLGHNNLDAGSIRSDNVKTVNRQVIGANGTFAAAGKDWTWDVYFQYSYSRNTTKGLNNVKRAEYALATDAVTAPAGIAGITPGAIVCRSSLTNPANGCVPWNAMGINVNGIAGSNYIHGTSQTNYRLNQYVWSGTVGGEPFDVWAGPVSVSANVEHRRESIFGLVDPIGNIQGWFAGNFASIKGQYTVTEGALEAVIPLAKDKSWAETWDLNAAVRATDYSTSGYVTTWKIGTTYTPIPDIKLRITRSRDIRAPNLNELYSNGSVGQSNVFDPFTSTNPNVRVTTRGNPALKPEKADTTGIGIVLQPRVLEGFSVSADYWNVRVTDAITNVAIALAINQCFQGVTIFCSSFVRTNGIIVTGVSVGYNQALQDVKGVDIEASYRVPLENIISDAPGNLSLHANMTRYLRNYNNNRISPPTTNLGVTPRFWNLTTTATYDLFPYRFSLTARSLASGPYNANGIECQTGCPVATTTNPTYNYNRAPGTFYVDAAFNYAFEPFDGFRGEFFLNVRNLANTDPPSTPNPATDYSIRTGSGVYDVLGRVYRGGFRFRL